MSFPNSVFFKFVMLNAELGIKGIRNWRLALAKKIYLCGTKTIKL